MQDPHKTAIRMKLETEAPRAYTHAERLHTHVKEPVGYVRVRWIMETSKQSSMHQMCRGLQNVEVGHYTVNGRKPGEGRRTRQVLPLFECIALQSCPDITVLIDWA